MNLWEIINYQTHFIVNGDSQRNGYYFNETIKLFQNFVIALFNRLLMNINY